MINANEAFINLSPEELSELKKFEKMHQELSFQRDKVEAIIKKFQKEYEVIDCEDSCLEGIALPYDRTLRAITYLGYIDTEDGYGPDFFDLGIDTAIDIVMGITSMYPYK